MIVCNCRPRTAVCPCETGSPIDDRRFAARRALSGSPNMPTCTNRAPAGIMAVENAPAPGFALLPECGFVCFAARVVGKARPEGRSAALSEARSAAAALTPGRAICGATSRGSTAATRRRPPRASSIPPHMPSVSGAPSPPVVPASAPSSWHNSAVWSPAPARAMPARNRGAAAMVAARVVVGSDSLPSPAATGSGDGPCAPIAAVNPVGPAGAPPRSLLLAAPVGPASSPV